ncbi:MAG TPA: DUF4364 family protein [Candidatus Scatomonas pullistercoris]|uniref:DUF4364 family protein n=1 Tax=Candidatus Scatomonas pullistercoris TaxID=2840920 RepID=A0A9D1P2W4_9FIRM|nr:DUF4364 family protein [Candidatus Scatomonas pullistercoris]
MIESTYSLYKLIILYMLKKVSFPLTNAQISDFILGQEYTSYFHLQEVLSEMHESGLIQTESIHNATYYRMTDSGRQTLEFFEKEISSEIRQDIQRYLTDHSYEMRNESSILADYYRTAGQDYAVHCRVKEGNTVLIDLTITVPTEGAAQTLCDNWKKKSQETYAAIMKLLM